MHRVLIAARGSQTLEIDTIQYATSPKTVSDGNAARKQIVMFCVSFACICLVSPYWRLREIHYFLF